MSDWVTIFDSRPEIDGSPVRGLPDEFQAAGDFFQEMCNSSTEVLEQFELIKSDSGVEQFQGETAVAFAGIVDSVKDSLGELPRVSDEAAQLLTAHVESLGVLRTRAEEGVNSALVRAQTHWNDKNAANTQVENEDATISSYLYSMSLLQAPGVDPNDDSTRDSYQRTVDSARGRRRTAATDRDNAEACLTIIGDEWVDIRAEEEELSIALDRAIDDIKLASLSDPGRLESLARAFGDAITSIPILGGMIEAYVGMLKAVFTGDLALFLHSLSEYLGGFLTIMAFVALFTPIGPIVAGIILAVAVVKLGVDAYLYQTQTAHPETGETVSLVDVGFSAISVVGAAGALNVARAGGGTISVFGNSRNATASVFNSGVQGASRTTQASQVASDVGSATTYGQTAWNGLTSPDDPVQRFVVDTNQTTGTAAGTVTPPNVNFDFEIPTGTAPATDWNGTTSGTPIPTTEPIPMPTTAPIPVPTTAPVAMPTTAPVTIDVTAPTTVPVIVPVDVDVEVRTPVVVGQD